MSDELETIKEEPVKLLLLKHNKLSSIEEKIINELNQAAQVNVIFNTEKNFLSFLQIIKRKMKFFKGCGTVAGELA